MNILLLEPDKILAEVYASALMNSGHNVSLGTDAQTAIHTIDEKLPDLIIMELLLARHNGVEFLYELRSYSEWTNIPVILLTAVQRNALSAALQDQLGVNAYLYKPRTDIQKLLRMVERIHTIEVS